MTKILFCPLIYLLVSCQRQDFSTNEIDGIVKDKTSLSAISGATVYLLESEIPDLFGPPSPSYIIDSTLTDDFGKFQFQYERNDGYGYAVHAKKDHYIDNTLTTSIFESDIGPGIDVELLISPEAFLKLRVHNIKWQSSNDYINVSVGLIGLYFGPFYGAEVDTTTTVQVYGNIINDFVVFTSNFNGQMEMPGVRHNIYCPSFDTTYYEILY